MDKKLEELFTKYENLKLTRLAYEDGSVKLELETYRPTNKPDISNGNQELQYFNIEKDNLPIKNIPLVTEDCKEDTLTIKSPMVGIVYRKLSPKDQDLVKEGQEIKEGDVICIIEAMKMYNEIKSPYAGIIKEIKFNNGDFVAFDDVLFEVKSHD